MQISKHSWHCFLYKAGYFFTTTCDQRLKSGTNLCQYVRRCLLGVLLLLGPIEIGIVLGAAAGVIIVVVCSVRWLAGACIGVRVAADDFFFEPEYDWKPEGEEYAFFRIRGWRVHLGHFMLAAMLAYLMSLTGGWGGGSSAVGIGGLALVYAAILSLGLPMAIAAYLRQWNRADIRREQLKAEKRNRKAEEARRAAKAKPVGATGKQVANGWLAAKKVKICPKVEFVDSR